MPHELVKIGTGAHTWEALVADWKAQTESQDEEFDESLQLTANILKPLAERGDPAAGVYAHYRDKAYWATCQINTANLPGYKLPVMRVRFLAFSPIIDLGDDNINLYSSTLVEVFVNVMNLCMGDGPMKAGHIHFHLPSPQDRTFFTLLGSNIAATGTFKTVEAKGAWLYITI